MDYLHALLAAALVLVFFVACVYRELYKAEILQYRIAERDAEMFRDRLSVIEETLAARGEVVDIDHRTRTATLYMRSLHPSGGTVPRDESMQGLAEQFRRLGEAFGATSHRHLHPRSAVEEFMGMSRQPPPPTPAPTPTPAPNRSMQRRQRMRPLTSLQSIAKCEPPAPPAPSHPPPSDYGMDPPIA